MITYQRPTLKSMSQFLHSEPTFLLFRHVLIIYFDLTLIAVTHRQNNDKQFYATNFFPDFCSTYFPPAEFIW